MNHEETFLRFSHTAVTLAMQGGMNHSFSAARLLKRAADSFSLQ